MDTFLAEITRGAGIDATTWTEDAILDATVPHWRFECDGAEAVTAELSGWYAAPTTLETVVRRPIPGGEAVELDLSWVEAGVPHAAHQVHLITVDGGRISRDTVFCGGRWPAALLAEMEAVKEAARGH